MNPTNRTITFSEGSNGLSTHTVFQDDDGVDHIVTAKRGFVKITDVQKPVHDEVQFLKDAQNKTGKRTPEPAMADAMAAVNKSADPSSPVYILDGNGRLKKVRDLPGTL